jgi:protein-S-isoprenylcysteine O-methyltransferase Ste14
MVAGIWLFHRQVLREEEYLKKYYRQEYLDYCKRVKGYLRTVTG